MPDNPRPSSVHSLLLLLAPTKPPTKVPPSALRALGRLTSRTTGTTSDPTTDALGPINSAIRDPARRTPVRALVILAPTLRTIDAFLGDSVADGLEQAAFAQLAGHGGVDAVLELVDGFDAGDFCFVEFACYGSVKNR